MTRAEIEASIWAITGRELTGAQVDRICDACDEYVSERARHDTTRILHPLVPAPPVDLYPVIGLLADLLMGESVPDSAMADAA